MVTENLDSGTLPQESATLRYEYFYLLLPAWASLPTAGSLLATGSIPTDDSVSVYRW